MSVKIFFMITAYLFSKKVLYSSKKVSWKNLYISRAFRIIPLYFLAFAFTIIYSLIIASPSAHTIFSNESFQYLLGWLLFASNDLFWYSDAAKITAGVTWTLKYEWVFYFSLPLILFLMKNKLGVLIPLLLAVLVFSHTNIPLLSTDAFIPFLFGYLAAMSKSSKNVYLQKLFLTKKLPYAGLILVLFFIPSTKFHGIIASIPAFIIFIKSTDNSIGNSILKMKSVIYLGEISYSIYLLHGVVLFTIAKIIGIKIENYMMPIISIIVIATASITYKIIEKPFINIGRNITRKNKA